MTFRFIRRENATQGTQGNAQAGTSNQDNGAVLESGIKIPWTFNPRFSWLDYRCWVEVRLDPGLALHKPLPQKPMPADSLASGFIDDANFDGNVNGVNTTSKGVWADVVQRMATSEYRFVLKGYALRAGYQIPVPGLKTVAGVPAVPDNPQWSSGNVLVSNMSGIPLWMCRWELWYFVIAPPKQQQMPPPNVADHIAGNITLPQNVQVPWSQPDRNAVPGAIRNILPGPVNFP